MEEQIFLCQLADIIIRTVSNKKYKNLKTTIIQEGHFNGRVHTHEQMSCMVMRNFVRYLLNIGMEIPRKDFEAMMMQLTDEFYRVADSEIADIINQAHARKKK
jgi:hypothetical protein